MVLPHLSSDVQEGHPQLVPQSPKDFASGDGQSLEPSNPLQFCEGDLVFLAHLLGDDPPRWPIVDQLCEGFRHGRWRGFFHRH
jgi:hypothetical protein